MGCAWSCETERFRWRDWNSEVFPDISSPEANKAGHRCRSVQVTCTAVDNQSKRPQLNFPTGFEGWPKFGQIFYYIWALCT